MAASELVLSLEKSEMKSTANHSRWRFWFAVIVLVATATALRVWPLQVLGTRLAWLTFYPAVMAATICGGFAAGLLPICAGSKKIQDDTGYWHKVEAYIEELSVAKFTQGLCPICIKKFYPNLTPEELDPTPERAVPTKLNFKVLAASDGDAALIQVTEHRTEPAIERHSFHRLRREQCKIRRMHGNLTAPPHASRQTDFAPFQPKRDGGNFCPHVRPIRRATP